MSRDLTPRQFALLLSLTPNLGSKGIERILRVNAVEGRTIDAFLQLSREEKLERYDLKPKAAEALSIGLADLLAQLERLDNQLRATNVGVFTVQDASYPHVLLEFMPEPPALLFVYGNAQLLSQPTFCVMASRDAAKGTLLDVESSVERLLFERKVIVSGHSTPAYQRASVAALRWGAPRILALDCGLNQALGEDLTQEPFRVARLYRYQFDPKTDLVVSPFRLHDRFIGVNNQIRDEIIFGLAKEAVIVAARAGGQMETLGRRALRLGRTVYVHPPRQDDEHSKGNQALIEAGAIPVERLNGQEF